MSMAGIRRQSTTASFFGLPSGGTMRRSGTSGSLVKQNEHSVLGASLGARKSSRAEYLLPDGSLPSPGEVDQDFHPTDLADLMILSRCVEPLRFTVGPDLLGYDVTVTSLKEAFKSHIEFLRQRALRTSSSSFGEASAVSGDSPLRGDPAASTSNGYPDEEELKLNPGQGSSGGQDAAGDHHRRASSSAAAAPASDSSIQSLRRALDEEGSAAQESVLNDIDRVCRHVAALHSRELNVTFGELFDFEFPLFPETTEEDRVLLQEVCSNSEVVARADVERALNVSSASQVVEFIFTSGAEALPVEVFKDIVDCLGTHPNTVSFAPEFVTKMASTGQGMQGLILHIITLIAVLVVCPKIVLSEHVELHENLLHWTNNDWTTGCPEGAAQPASYAAAADAAAAALRSPTVVPLGNTTTFGASTNPSSLSAAAASSATASTATAAAPLAAQAAGETVNTAPLRAGACNFLWRNFMTSTRPELDGLRYLRRELVQFFWREPNRTIADTPVGGVWPVGGLVIRMVKDGIGGNSGDPERCAKFNLTESTAHWEVPMYAGCGHEWGVFVPFSYTREEALAAVANVSLPTNVSGTTAIIAHFSGYHPSAGMLVHAKVFFTFPRGGGMMPRFYISPIDPTTHELVLVFLVLKLIASAFAIGAAVYYGVSGMPFVFDAMSELLQLLLLCTAYGYLSSVSEAPDNLRQTSYPPKNFDTWAFRYDTGMSCLGFFAFFFVASTIRFSPHIRGLQLLFDILRVAAFELVGLIIMFIIWSFAFVCVSMTLFGSTVRTFSSMPSATRHLLLYFLSESDFGSLFENAPTAGPAFFFAYQLFVVFFALNLLIAVITAPLVKVKSRNELQDQVYAKTRALLGEASLFHRAKFVVDYYVLWPFAGIFFDCTPLTQRVWVTLHRAVGSIYHADEVFSNDLARTRGVLAAAADFMDVIAEGSEHHDADFLEKSLSSSNCRGMSSVLYMVSERHLWDSPLLTLVIDERIIHNDIALALVVVSIASESKYNTVRDARLMTALKYFDEFDSRLSAVMEIQAGLKTQATEHAQSLHDRLLEQRIQHGSFAMPAASFRFGSGPGKAFGSMSGGNAGFFGSVAHSPEGTAVEGSSSVPMSEINSAMGSTQQTPVTTTHAAANVTGSSKPPLGSATAASGGGTRSGMASSHRKYRQQGRGQLTFGVDGMSAGEQTPDDSSQHVQPGQAYTTSPSKAGVGNDQGPLTPGAGGLPLAPPVLQPHRLSNASSLQDVSDEDALNKTHLSSHSGAHQLHNNSHAAMAMALRSGGGSAGQSALAGSSHSRSASGTGSMRRPSVMAVAADAQSSARVVTTNGMGYNASGREYEFTLVMRNKLSNATQLLFYSVTSLVFAVFFFAPFFIDFEATAFLTYSLHAGLRDQEVVTECYDAACTQGWSMNKTLLNTGDIGEYHMWLDGVFARQVYTRQVFNLSTTVDSSAVLWDPSVLLAGPVHFRQLRSMPDPDCAEEYSPLASGFSRHAAAAGFPCKTVPAGSGGWARGPMPYPRSGVPVLGDPSAYEFQADTCAEAEPKMYFGRIYDYPCEGYSVTVHNYSQFREVVDSGWFDQYTRLAAITANFAHLGSENAVEYTMLMELGENGGGSFGRAFSFATQSDSALSKLEPQRVAFQVMLCLDLLWSVILFGRYIYYDKFGAGKRRARGIASKSHAAGQQQPPAGGAPVIRRQSLVAGMNARDRGGSFAATGGSSRHLHEEQVLVVQTDESATVLRPSVPLVDIAIFALVFVGLHIMFPVATQRARHNTYLNVCAIAYLTYKVTTKIIFPAASLLSRQVRVLIATLQNAVVQILKVIPYFVVFLWAFLLAGFLIFGRVVPQFGRLRWAIMNIGVAGFGEGFDFHTLHNARFIEAVFYTVFFFCVVIVVLANLFLAMVTSASGDAQSQAPCVALVEGILRYNRKRVMYGKFLTGFLAAAVYALEAEKRGSALARFITPRALITPHRPLAANMVENTRLLFPSEVLLTTLSPLRVNGILRALHYRDLNERAFAALMPFILSNFVRFQAMNPYKAARDARLEAIEEKALIRLGVKAGWGGANTNNGSRHDPSHGGDSESPQEVRLPSMRQQPGVPQHGFRMSPATGAVLQSPSNESLSGGDTASAARGTGFGFATRHRPGSTSGSDHTGVAMRPPHGGLIAQIPSQSDGSPSTLGGGTPMAGSGPFSPMSPGALAHVPTRAMASMRVPAAADVESIG